MTPPCQYLSLLCSFGKSKYSPNSKPRRPKYTVFPFIFARHHFNIQFCLATLIRCNYNSLLENKNIFEKKNPKTNDGHLSYAIIIHLIVRFCFCILFGTNYFQSLQGNCDSPPSYNFYKRIYFFFLAIITLFLFFFASIRFSAERISSPPEEVTPSAPSAGANKRLISRGPSRSLICGIPYQRVYTSIGDKKKAFVCLCCV